MTDEKITAESRAMHERYARRTRTYDPLAPWVLMTRQELERALSRWARYAFSSGVAQVTLLEVGCGSGGNLQQLMRLGFAPENLSGNELQADRATQAVRNLPAAVRIEGGNALDLNLAPGSLDVVFQSLVFSSVLDKDVQAIMANRMWQWVRPGGGILWYDFTVNNPSNPDVQGVPLRRVRELLPEASMQSWRVTLAPPLSRLVTRLHPALYGWCNLVPWLRTHQLCWLQKREVLTP